MRLCVPCDDDEWVEFIIGAGAYAISWMSSRGGVRVRGIDQLRQGNSVLRCALLRSIVSIVNAFYVDSSMSKLNVPKLQLSVAASHEIECCPVGWQKSWARVRSEWLSWQLRQLLHSFRRESWTLPKPHTTTRHDGPNAAGNFGQFNSNSSASSNSTYSPAAVSDHVRAKEADREREREGG